MNRNRSIYYLYLLLFFIVYGILFIWASFNTQNETGKSLLLIIGIIMLVAEPVAISYIYRNIKKDGGTNSDEREQTVIQRALANTGVTAIILAFLPYLASFVFPNLMPYVTFGYIFIIGSIFKISIFYYNKKF